MSKTIKSWSASGEAAAPSADIPDEIDYFVDPAPVEAPNVKALLGREHLLAALPVKARRAIEDRRPLVVVVETPSEAWTQRIEIAAGDLFRANVVSAATAPSKNMTPRTPTVEGPVVAISHNLAWLSPTLVDGADLIVALRADARAVENVIKNVCGRRALVRPADLAGLDFTDLAFAIRPGSPRACVGRLRKAAAARSVISPADRTPTLDQLVGYGASLDQMRAIAADVVRVRAGSLDAGSLPSVLLHGEPGTGKTMLVKSFAKSAGLPLISTSVSAWFTSTDGHLGAVAKASQAFFDAVAAAAPAVGFLDELDALPDRASLDAKGRDWWLPIVTGVLLMIDKVRARGSGVILIAATNHIDHVDAALKRPGRFDRHLEIVGPRDAAELSAVLRHHLGDDLKDLDLEVIARLGLGGTGAAAEQWVRSARETARGADRPMTVADLSDAIAPPDGRTPDELRSCALHEAAHAIIGHVLSQPITGVSVVGTETTGGRTSFEFIAKTMTRHQLEDCAISALAGRAADEKFGDGATSGAASDLAFVTRMVASIHGVLGLGDSLLVRGDFEEAEKRLVYDFALSATVEAEIQRLMAKTRDLVGRHADAIRRLAEVLVANRVATPADIAQAMEPLQLSPALSSKPAKSPLPAGPRMM